MTLHNLTLEVGKTYYIRVSKECGFSVSVCALELGTGGRERNRGGEWRERERRGGGGGGERGKEREFSTLTEMYIEILQMQQYECLCTNFRQYGFPFTISKHIL